MAAITIQNVTKQFGTQVVLEGVSLDLHKGEIVGLVGANGAGKTTLFRVIAGEIPPDLGTVTRARGLDIGLLPQEPDLVSERTLRAEVASACAGLTALEGRLHERASQIAACTDEAGLADLMSSYERIDAQFIAAGGHTFEIRLNEVLGGLGFAPAEYDRPLSLLSGGQKCRAALAKLLLGDRSFLLLDEPTNHLDIDAVRWLEKFLAGHPGGAAIVSHDRYLLDRLCQRIVEIEHKKVTSYPGNYSNYVEVKSVRELTQQRQFEIDSEFIRKEQTFIAKNIYGQRTAEARGRRTRLKRRLAAGEFVTENPQTRRSIKLAFQKTGEHTGTILRCDDLSMRFSSDPLFTDLTFRVQAGQRLGITGPNGTGKTTLLRIILGELAPTGGQMALDAKLRAAYYAQAHQDLDPERTVVDDIRATFPEFGEHDARTLLARFLFHGNDVFKPLGLLSGGEQSRVRLAKLILQSADLLLLDEPTNHLDIPSLEALEEAVLEFPGTVIVVSHDRYFLDRIVDRLLVIRRDGHAVYDGNYSFYVEQIEKERTADAAERATVRRKKKPATKEERKLRSGPSPYDRMSIDQLDPALFADLQRRMDDLENEVAEVEAAWEDRVDTQ